MAQVFQERLSRGIFSGESCDLGTLVALQRVFHRSSSGVRRVNAYDEHDEFFLMKGGSDALYEFYQCVPFSLSRGDLELTETCRDSAHTRRSLCWGS